MGQGEGLLNDMMFIIHLQDVSNIIFLSDHKFR